MHAGSIRSQNFARAECHQPRICIFQAVRSRTKRVALRFLFSSPPPFWISILVKAYANALYAGRNYIYGVLPRAFLACM